MQKTSLEDREVAWRGEYAVVTEINSGYGQAREEMRRGQLGGKLNLIINGSES